MSQFHDQVELALGNVSPASHSSKSIDFASPVTTVKRDSARISEADSNQTKVQPGDGIFDPKTIDHNQMASTSPTMDHMNGVDRSQAITQPLLNDAIRSQVLDKDPVGKQIIKTLETERSPSSCFEQEGREGRKAILTSQISVTELGIREKKLQVKELTRQLRTAGSLEEATTLQTQMIRVQQSIRTNTLSVKEFKKQLRMEEVHENEGRRRQQEGKLIQQCRDFIRVAWDVSWM